jgi:hypothetical protein
MTKEEREAYNLAIDDCISLVKLMIAGSNYTPVPKSLRDGINFKQNKNNRNHIPSLKYALLRFGRKPVDVINVVDSFKKKTFNGLRSMKIKGENHIPNIRFHGLEKLDYYYEGDDEFSFNRETTWRDVDNELSQLDFNNGNLKGGFFDSK